MRDKEGLLLSRGELADYLEQLSRQLRQGKLETKEGRGWAVPPEIDAKIDFKEKKGRLKVKLSWSWSTLGEYEPAAQEVVARWQTSIKEVKDRMGASFAALQRTVRQGGFPTPEALEGFAESSRALVALAEPEWQEAIAEFLAHLENLERAVAARQHDAVAHELDDLRNRMAACHREFK